MTTALQLPEALSERDSDFNRFPFMYATLLCSHQSLMLSISSLATWEEFLHLDFT